MPAPSSAKSVGPQVLGYAVATPAANLDSAAHVARSVMLAFTGAGPVVCCPTRFFYEVHMRGVYGHPCRFSASLRGTYAGWHIRRLS